MAKKIPLIFILILGLGLRLINLNQSFWLDEASQAQMSSRTVEWIWSGRQNDFHPPLFYLLAHFWLQLGKSEFFLRLLPVFFGTANIWAIYALSKKLLTTDKIKIKSLVIDAGYMSAFLLAINPFAIYYSQEFRTYSLLGLLGTLAVYYLFTNKWRWLTLINLLLIYTHYSSAFLIIAQFTYLIFYKRQNLRPFGYSLLISLLLYAPWLPQLWGQIQAGTNIDNYLPGWRSLLSVSAFKIVPLTFFKLTAGRITFLSKYIYYPYAAFVLACVFASFKLAKQNRDFIFNWILVPVLSMIVFSVVFPQNQPFRVIYIIPGLVILSVQACQRFPKLFLTFMIYIALVGNVSYFTRPRLQREQWRQSLEYLSSKSSSSVQTVVKFSGKFSPFDWYAPQLPVLAAVPTFPAQAGQVASVMSDLSNSQITSVYLFDYLGELTDPRRQVDQTLVDQGFSKDKTINFEGVGLIHLFNKNP